MSDLGQSNRSSSRPICGQESFGSTHICQLPAGHDGCHLDDRTPNLVCGWPATTTKIGEWNDW